MTVQKLFFFEFGNPKLQYIRAKVTVHKDEETIEGKKLFKGRNYMMKQVVQKRNPGHVTNRDLKIQNF